MPDACQMQYAKSDRLDVLVTPEPVEAWEAGPNSSICPIRPRRFYSQNFHVFLQFLPNRFSLT